jgi:hypothetical protein
MEITAGHHKPTVVDNRSTIATLSAISGCRLGSLYYASSQLTAPSASDNCTTVTRSPASLVKGPNTVTWTATDGNNSHFNTNCNLSRQSSSNYSHLDSNQCKCRLGSLYLCQFSLTAPSASDNCTTVTVTRSPASLVKGPNSNLDRN